MLLKGYFRLCCALLLLFSATIAHAASIVLVLSENSRVYQDFAQAFSSQLQAPSGSVQLTVTDVAQLQAVMLNDSSLIVGVGSRAAEALATHELSQPVLLGMIPRATFERLRVHYAKAAAVFIDQPPARYIGLARLALPEHEHIGLLTGRDSKESVARLLTAARDQHLRAQSEPVTEESDLFTALQRLFPDGGVLLATPDTTVFNAHTLPSILLGAFRRKVPVIGFSPAYVSAGAVLALYSSPEQLAAQSAEIARAVLNGAALPASQYPRQFSIGINERVARSLGLNLESSSTLRERLEKLERQP